MKSVVLFLLILCIGGNFNKSEANNNQTNQLYQAERVLMDQKGSVFLKNRGEVNRYLNNIFADSWFKKNFKIQKPQLIKSDKPDWAFSVLSGAGGKIAVPDSGCWNWVILHEVAHHIVPNDNHGRNFAKVELILIEHFLNSGASNALRQSFKKNNVKF